jgi:hypothetical protein
VKISVELKSGLKESEDICRVKKGVERKRKNGY